MKILNKSEFKQLINELDEIPKGEISIVYENDRWDGPIEGVCRWEDKEYYFFWYGGTDEEKVEMIRKFLLINLTEQQMKEEKREHARFIELDQNGKLQEFYKEAEGYPEIKINREQLIGWFAD